MDMPHKPIENTVIVEDNSDDDSEVVPAKMIKCENTNGSFPVNLSREVEARILENVRSQLAHLPKGSKMKVKIYSRNKGNSLETLSVKPGLNCNVFISSEKGPIKERLVVPASGLYNSIKMEVGEPTLSSKMGYNEKNPYLKINSPEKVLIPKLKEELFQSENDYKPDNLFDKGDNDVEKKDLSVWKNIVQSIKKLSPKDKELNERAISNLAQFVELPYNQVQTSKNVGDQMNITKTQENKKCERYAVNNKKCKGDEVNLTSTPENIKPKAYEVNSLNLTISEVNNKLKKDEVNLSMLPENTNFTNINGKDMVDKIQFPVPINLDNSPLSNLKIAAEIFIKKDSGNKKSSLHIDDEDSSGNEKSSLHIDCEDSISLNGDKNKLVHVSFEHDDFNPKIENFTSKITTTKKEVIPNTKYKSRRSLKMSQIQDACSKNSENGKRDILEDNLKDNSMDTDSVSPLNLGSDGTVSLLYPGKEVLKENAIEKVESQLQPISTLCLKSYDKVSPIYSENENKAINIDTVKMNGDNLVSFLSQIQPRSDKMLDSDNSIYLDGYNLESSKSPVQSKSDKHISPHHVDSDATESLLYSEFSESTNLPESDKSIPPLCLKSEPICSTLHTENDVIIDIAKIKNDNLGYPNSTIQPGCNNSISPLQSDGTVFPLNGDNLVFLESPLQLENDDTKSPLYLEENSIEINGDNLESSDFSLLSGDPPLLSGSEKSMSPLHLKSDISVSPLFSEKKDHGINGNNFESSKSPLLTESDKSMFALHLESDMDSDGTRSHLFSENKESLFPVSLEKINENTNLRKDNLELFFQNDTAFIEVGQLDEMLDGAKVAMEQLIKLLPGSPDAHLIFSGWRVTHVSLIAAKNLLAFNCNNMGTIKLLDQILSQTSASLSKNDFKRCGTRDGIKRQIEDSETDIQENVCKRKKIEHMEQDREMDILKSVAKNNHETLFEKTVDIIKVSDLNAFLGVEDNKNIEDENSNSNLSRNKKLRIVPIQIENKQNIIKNYNFESNLIENKKGRIVPIQIETKQEYNKLSLWDCNAEEFGNIFGLCSPSVAQQMKEKLKKKLTEGPAQRLRTSCRLSRVIEDIQEKRSLNKRKRKSIKSYPKLSFMSYSSFVSYSKPVVKLKRCKINDRRNI